jgi:hypothetical protein
MKEQIKLKLNILATNGVVSESTVKKIYTIDKSILSIIPNIESIDTDFTYTHLAMAIDRVEKDKQLTESNDAINEQLQESEFYPESKDLLDNLSTEISVKFNEAESIMILLHLCNLVSQRGE